MKKALTACGLALLLSGCATATYNYTPQAESFSVPEVGETATRMVGERMLVQGVSAERDAIRVDTLQTIGGYKVNPGVYHKVGEDSGYSHYGQSGGAFITQGLFNAPAMGMSIRTASNGETCIIGLANMMRCGDLRYTEISEELQGESNFQQTLIYSGKIGDVVTLSYREFTGGMARDAFTNRVEYDLTQSDVVSYQGAKLRILDANNSSIRYEVLSPFQ